MAKAKKLVTEETVEKVKAAAEDAKASVKAIAETAAEKADAVVEKAKTVAAKPRRTKKADAPAAAPAAKAEKAPKAAKTTKKTAAPALETKVVIELAEKSATADDLVARAKEDWVAKGNTLESMTGLSLYINAVEGMVYYVVNDDYLSGSFAI